jgi:hypothetical protein
MLRWLSLEDEELPTWLHTLLWLAIVSFFAVPEGLEGFEAIATRRLEPSMDNEWIGPHALEGSLAVAAGFLQVELMITLYALAIAYSRLGESRKYLRTLSWGLFGVYVAVGFLIASKIPR